MFLSSHVENDGSAALTSKALIDMSFSNCVYKNEYKKKVEFAAIWPVYDSASFCALLY